MSLTKCIKKAGKALDIDDADAIRASRDALAKDGMNPGAAGIEAVRLHIQDVLAERAAIVEQVEAQGGAAPSAPALQNFEGGTDADIPDGGARSPADAATDEAGGSTAGQADVGNTVPVRSDGGASESAEGTAPADGEVVSGADAAADEQPALTRAEPIDDVGEKIGGARKDTATSTGKKSAKVSDDRPTWAKRFQVSEIVTSTRSSEVGKWAITDTRKKDRLGNARQVSVADTEQEAIDSLPLIAVAQKHIIRGSGDKYSIWRKITDRKIVRVVSQDFGTRDEAMRHMAQNAVQILETKTTFGEADLPRPESTARTGEPRREGDATNQKFLDDFGLRAVEFGIWNNQQERQEVMNAAYDGLMDLADVLGIPPNAIGLNGDLSLAFGARGQGLNSAAAHYERDKAVINLTKMNGAGALAHEWFHALDHYFGRQDGKASSEWVAGSDGTKSLAAKGRNQDYVSHGFGRKSGVRPELVEAYDSLMDTMFKKGVTYVEDTQKADKFVASTRDELATELDRLRQDLSEQKDPRYWKRKNKPASAEQLAEFDTIAKQLVGGEFLEMESRPNQPNKKRSLSFRWTNDAVDKLSQIYKDVRGRSGFNAQNHGPMDSLGKYMSRYSQRLKQLSDAQGETEKTRSVPTDFAMSARELDQGRGEDYWTTPHEMAARAFQGYVEDRIADKGGKSPFLNYGSERAVIETPWGWKPPFPRGDERKAINQELDQFVSELKTQENEKEIAGQVRKVTALYSRGQPVANPHTRDSLIESMNRAFPGVFGALEKAGLARIVSRDQIPEQITGGKFSKAQTETPAFQKWFGESKVVDESGAPKVMYHGTLTDFDAFDKQMVKGRFSYSIGFHFTDSQREANAYTAERDGLDLATQDGANVVPVFLRAENPLIIDTKEPSASMEVDLRRHESIIPKLLEAKRAGTPYDSVIIRRTNKPEDSEWDHWNVIVFDPTQIKSAVGNTGTFDSANPDIRYSKDGRVLAYVQNGQVTFVADNIAKGHNVKGLMLHEIGVHLRQLGQGDTEFQDILKQFEGLARIGGSKAAMAMARVPKDTPANLKAEEGLGYLVEMNPDAPLVKRLADWFRAQLRKWLGSAKGLDRTRLMKWANGLTESDLIAMATRAVRSTPAAAQESTGRQEAMASAPRDKWYRPALADTVRGMDKIAGKDGMVQPAQAKSWLQSQQKKGAYKQEEMEWSGLSEWLDLQPGKVSVEAISDYMESGGVQVEDVTLGDTSSIEQSFDAEGYSLEFDGDEAIYIDPDGDAVDYSGLPFELRQAVDRASKSGVEPTKYDSYTLPGGTNYREVLLTLPAKADRNSEAWMTEARSRYAEKDIPRLSEGQKEIVDRAASGMKYQSGHWDAPNVLAHIRMNDRNDSDGARVLFIEEVQSDWAQDGRKQGFIKGPLHEQPMVATINESAYEPYWEVRTESGAFVANVVHIKAVAGNEQQAIDEARQVAMALRTQRGVPDAPFVGKTDAWVSLAMKRIIALAAEGGYEKVAFVNGEQSAERYDLSKKVGAIEYTKVGDGQYQVYVSDLGDVGIMDQTLSEPELEANFGKDVAEKIVQGGNSGQLSGDGLRVGGDGMKAFYDQIVPKVARDVLKKVGGGKMEGVDVSMSNTSYQVEHPHGFLIDASDMESAKQIAETVRGKIKTGSTSTQAAFTITDTMRQKVQEGLPLFSRQKQTDTPEFRKWFSDSKAVDENGRPAVLYHGTPTGGFTVFDTEKQGTKGGFSRGGFSFTTNRDAAKAYAEGFTDEDNALDAMLIEANQAFSEIDSGKLDPDDWEDMSGGLDVGESMEWSWQVIDSIDDARDGLGDVAAAIKETQPELAQRLRDIAAKDYESSPEVFEVYLRLPPESPEYDATPETVGQVMAGVDVRNLPGRAAVVNMPNGEKVYYVADPGQIKSATGNRGTFDPADPNILFSRAEQESPDSRENLNRRMREEHHGIWFKAKQMARREFLPGGLLPKSVFDEKVKRDSKMGAVEMDVTKHVLALEEAFKKDFGKGFKDRTKAQELMMRDALGGNPGKDMPERTAVALEAMRQYVDRYSEQYVEVLRSDAMRLMEGMEPDRRQGLMAQLQEGDLDGLSAAEGQIAQKVMLMQTIAGNVGEYVHRSYRAFDDPMWPRAVPDAVLNNARDYLEAQYLERNEGADESQAVAAADRVIEGILKEGTAFDSLESYIRESKLGAKDLSLLKRRKQIAPEIRALLGEHTDPRVNFAKTATKMTRLIHNDAFLKRVREVGMGVFLYEDGRQPAGNWKTIAAEGNEAYAPLNGLKVSPEINQAFIDALGRENMEGWYRTIVQLNGAVKFGKTVLSPTTAMRNFMSAAFFSMANGHFDMTHGLKSLKVHLNKTGDNFDYLRELKELGVVYDTPYAEEMMRLLRDTDMEDRLLNNRLGLKHVLDAAQAYYRFGDDYHKVVGFENEVALQQKHYGLTRDEAKIKAAERIRNTYPTYSMTGRFVNKLRRFPLAGTFVSFPAEIIRTSFHILQYAKQDMAQSKALGARRIVGLSMVAGLAYAAQELSKGLLGVDDDEEEAVREQLPEWSKNSNLYFLSRDDGKLRYVDLSFLDPYNYWKRPITAVVRDQPMKDSAYQAAAEMLSPFFGTDIAFGALAEIWNNKKSSGGQVYNKSETPVEQTKAIADHLRKAVQPGAFSNLERILQAAKGERTITGRTYSMEDEMAALVGFRVSTLDPGISLKYRSFSVSDELRGATSIISRTVRDPNPVSDERLRDAFDRATMVRKEAYKDLLRAIKAAEKSGLDRAAVIRQLRAGGLSKKDAAMLAAGKAPPKLSSNQYLMSAVTSARDTFGPDVQKEINRRRLQILKWERELLRRQ